MNSLVITDKEKYGNDSPCCSPCGSSGKGKDKVRKYAPTVELSGSQVTALGLDTAKIGDKITIKIAATVKAFRAGESYGEELVTKASPTKVTIQLLAGEPTEGAAEDPAAELPAEEEAAAPAAEEDAEKPLKQSGEKVSPSEAFAEDEDSD